MRSAKNRCRGPCPAPAATKHTSWLSGLLAVGQPESGCPGAHLGLGELADREQDPVELALTVSIDST